MSRTVTGTIKLPSGVAWVGAEVIFELRHAFKTSTTVYPKAEHKVNTDSNGQFSVDLATPDSGTARYWITLPDESQYESYIETGTAVDLVTLLIASGSGVAASELQTLLDAAEVFTIRSVSTTGNILAADEYIRASGTITLTLPAATGSGIAYAVKNVGSGTITIEGGGSETVDSVANVTISAGSDRVFIDVSSGAWDSVGGG